MKTPISPYVVAGRIFAIIGMSFFAAVAILFFIGGFWWWGIGAAVLFFPFLGLIALIERYSAQQGWIGPDAEPEPDLD